MQPILKKLNTYRGRVALLAGAVFIVLFAAIFIAGSNPSPIPKNISSAVSFPIYYPEDSRMPAGYELNLKTMDVVNPGVVILFVSLGNQSQYIAISEEKMPADSVISHFLSDNIPLHTSFSSPLGNSVIGAYNDGKEVRSVISLTINNGPWIIATAPNNISSVQFEKIVQSLIKN